MLAITLFSLFSYAMALVCYENIGNDVVEVSDPSWEYCVLVPEINGEKAKVFGIGPAEDSVTTYDTSFKQSDAVYKVLSVCVFEKYDLGAMNPRFPGPEFLFRCVCNYDRCNSRSTFGGYLSSMQEENS